MNKYLIFRTDRIGDFLISAILIKSIKSNDQHAHITVVSSSKNYDYIKKFKNVDNVLLLKNDALSKIKIFFKLSRQTFFNSIIIHDNKIRSKLISFFLRSKNKIFLKKADKYSHIDHIEHILEKLKFKLNEESLNIFDNQPVKSFQEYNNILFHFDEKWIHKDYIQKFTNIEPTLDQLINFLISLQKKTNKKIVITTGVKAPIVLKKCVKNLNNKNFEFLENLGFLDLETKVSQSKMLISCHGAISHVASANKIKQIDIIDKSYNYGRWTKHFRNYRSIYRDDFTILSKEILKKCID